MRTPLILSTMSLACLPCTTTAQAATATVRETAAVADPCGAIATATASKTEAEANGLRRDKDWADLCRYAADDMAVTGSVKLVLIGDSLTEGRQKA